MTHKTTPDSYFTAVLAVTDDSSGTIPWIKKKKKHQLNHSLGLSSVLTFHDLLDFHLQGDDLSHRGVIHITVNAVNGQTAILDSCHIIIFQEDHLVGVLNDGTGEANKWISKL